MTELELRQKELELKERELNLRERELELAIAKEQRLNGSLKVGNRKPKIDLGLK